MEVAAADVPNSCEDEHEWTKTSSSLSGDWSCSKCGVSTDGGPHDGRGYFPGRGKSKSFFRCRRIIIFGKDGTAIGWKSGE